MLSANYKTKSALKQSVGKELRYQETNFIGDPEYKATGKVTVVGPCAWTNRKWFAQVTLENGLIKKVS